MARALSVAEQTRLETAVRDSSRDSIKSAIWDIKANFSVKEWLGSRNRYVQEPYKILKADHAAGKSLSHKQLREYIAVSSILHCKDGWEYFSNAVNSILKGNSSNAVHFAYYAELRASLSFLASDGIGVFNGYNIYVDSSDRCHFINVIHPTNNKITRVSTHDFVWLGLNEWAKEPTKSDQILDVINVGGKSIKKWLSGAQMLSHSPLITTLTAEWFKEWSMDLEVINDDHNFRNMVSYNPQGIKHEKRFQSAIDEELKFIVAKWQLTTPSVQEKFQILDYYLLREALEKFYKIKYDLPAVSSKPKPKDFYTNTMSNIGLTIDANRQLMDFLLRKSYKTLSPVFTESRKKYLDDNGVPRALGILSRAFLLLRVATASVQDLLRECEIGKEDLDFWWKEIGLKRGLWKDGSEPAQFSDLWGDIETAIGDYNDFKSISPTFDLKTMHEYSQMNSHRFNQFHRAYLWGILE